MPDAAISSTDDAVIRVEDAPINDQVAGKTLTLIRVHDKAGVAAIDGWVHVWDGEHEVRLGPLTAEQAETLSDDLGYEAEPG